MLELILEALSELKPSELKKVIDTAEDLLKTTEAQLKKTHDQSYLAVRQEFLRHREDRTNFLHTQVDAALPPWPGLSEAKKKEFLKAWSGAIKFLVETGFPANEKLTEFLVLLVGFSSLIQHDGMKFKNVIESLKNPVNLLNTQFPGYYGTGAMEILISQVNVD